MKRSSDLFFRVRWQTVAHIVIFLLTIVYADDRDVASVPDTPSYGVDVSFPMQHAQVTETQKPFGDSVMNFYNSFLQGCRDFYKERAERCNESEQSRLNLNLRQPPVMQNYTSAGYAKVQVPSQIKKRLQDFWEDNKGEQHEEQWPAGNTYTNHWESPTYMLPFGDPKLKGGGSELQKILLESVQTTLEAWTGQSLVFTSLYGVRIYKDGAVLSPHIDRLPLVTSAIINVAQDVDEPWVLELIGHNGRATNVTLEPGEMILYESHSVIHGRPFPLKGRYYANVFLHFEPHGHTERYNENEAQDPITKQSIKERYVKALTNPAPKPPKYALPEYIKAGSEEEVKWSQQYIFQVAEPKKSSQNSIQEKPFIKSKAHAAAAEGDLSVLKQLAKNDPKALHEADRNGWRPIHEASRAGEVEAVEFLIKHGAEVNVRTNNGGGGTPLWWAQQLFDEDHPVVRLLERHGAVNIPPDPDQ